MKPGQAPRPRRSKALQLYVLSSQVRLSALSWRGERGSQGTLGICLVHIMVGNAAEEAERRGSRRVCPPGACGVQVCGRPVRLREAEGPCLPQTVLRGERLPGLQGLHAPGVSGEGLWGLRWRQGASGNLLKNPSPGIGPTCLYQAQPQHGARGAHPRADLGSACTVP